MLSNLRARRIALTTLCLTTFILGFVLILMPSPEAFMKTKKKVDSKPLEFEAEAMIQGQNWTYDLSLPSIRYALPHVVHSPKSLSPAFKWSQGRSHVSVVLGVPTVKRDHQSYLQSTLRSIFNNLQPEEEKDTLVVIFIAETDLNFVTATAKAIQASFSSQLESGILDIISPPLEYYPDWNNLKQTLGK